MTGNRIYIGTDRAGHLRWVARRRHSYSSHTHWGDDRANITNAELEAMRERERDLRDANAALTRENLTLKANLHAVEQDLRQSRNSVTELRQQVRRLAQENAELRRSLEAGGGSAERREIRELRHRNSRLEKENDSLTRRVRELTREMQDAIDNRVRDLLRQISDWRRRYEDLDRRHQRMRENLDAYVLRNDRLANENEVLRRRIESYEDLLRRYR
jgi:chromosome segregation ATPase